MGFRSLISETLYSYNQHDIRTPRLVIAYALNEKGIISIHTAKMIKHWLLIILIGFISISVFGQINTNRVEMGIIAGGNASHINFRKGSPPSQIDSDWKLGGLAGFYTRIHLTKRLAFQQSYVFSQMNSTARNPEIEYRLNYLSLPLTMQVQILPKLYIEAGAQFNLLINGEMQMKGENKKTENINHFMEARNVGGIIGLGYSISDIIQINTQFIHGFNHVDLLHEQTTKEFKSEVIQFSVLIDLLKL